MAKFFVCLEVHDSCFYYFLNLFDFLYVGYFAIFFNFNSSGDYATFMYYISSFFCFYLIFLFFLLISSFQQGDSFPRMLNFYHYIRLLAGLGLILGAFIAYFRSGFVAFTGILILFAIFELGANLYWTFQLPTLRHSAWANRYNPTYHHGGTPFSDPLVAPQPVPQPAPQPPHWGTPFSGGDAAPQGGTPFGGGQGQSNNQYRPAPQGTPFSN